MLAGRPDLVSPYLRRAAKWSDEFYGLLAQSILGTPIVFDWYEEAMRDDSVALMLRFPGAQRAVALAQVGQDKLAEAEIRKLAARARPELTYALAALAEAMRLPGAQMRVAQRLRLMDGRRHDGALYPVPAWEPVGGFRLDRALLYAIIRAESAFDIEARSSADARGVMQVLPQTARFVASLSDVAFDGVSSLYNPSINMQVGQELLVWLAGTRTVDDSLIHLVTAYNAGEGRLARWLEKDLRGLEKDPLLFIESVPFSETRRYTKKVLANLWAYRARLGQDIPSLRALAANKWPEVELLDR
jgi:soluble lytic murein transglycosylase-like protein